MHMTMGKVDCINLFCRYWEGKLSQEHSVGMLVLVCNLFSVECFVSTNLLVKISSRPLDLIPVA